MGSLISDNGTCITEIKIRIAMAKNAFNKRIELFSKVLSKKLTKNLIMTIIWSVALYRSENWTLWKYERDRLDAFKMWIWCRIENISWQDYQRLLFRQRKGEKKAFKYYIRKEKSMAMTHLERRKSWIRSYWKAVGRIERKS